MRECTSGDAPCTSIVICQTMFFYISFLRPPPLQSALSANIPITPQIANDLRTEHFDGSQDIYYSWSPSSTTQNEQPTTPIKLTTWRQSNAYKEIPVPPPHGVREGQQWRLLLTGDANPSSRSSPVAIDLNDKIVGKAPFPVMSMPILFTSRAPPKKSAKQEQIERVYDLRPAKGSGEHLDGGVSLRLVEQTSFDLDKVCMLSLWP